MQRLTPVQGIECAEDGGDLPTDEPFRLRAFLREPGSEVSMLGILHGKAVAHARASNLGKSIVHSERAWFPAEHLGEVRLA